MKIPLLGGTYQARSIIADVQRCVNLFPEENPGQDAGAQVTHYPTPGLDLLASGPVTGVSRCNYRATNNAFYRVIGQNVYSVNSGWVHTLLGVLLTPLSTTVSMSDNGIVVVVVDGSSKGYAINMATNAFAQITDPTFVGATRADYVDTFFVFNSPGTNQFYSSLSNVTFLQLTGNPGSILDGNISSQGTGYTNGTYTNVPATGGSGTGAIFDIVVLGNVVVQVTTNNAGDSVGMNYKVGDQLSATLPSGSGFTFAVTEIGGFAFDPTYIAAKTGSADPIVTIVVIHREIWLIGTLTTEIWYDAGAATFPFQELPGIFIEHGCIAPYSLSKHDLALFWLSQDREGNLLILKGEDYRVDRISTHAIETAIAQYSTVTDAIGYVYQQEGHIFYVLTFPTANTTWVYDKTTKLWHQRVCLDANGNLNRHLSNCYANVFSKQVVGDYSNGSLYAFNLNTYTDNGQPITRIRSFPHITNELKRVEHTSFVADMEVGTDLGSIDSSTQIHPPVVLLSWSDDRGKTFGNPVSQSLGALGKYLTNLKWNRLGIARDRVYQLQWSVPAKTALQSAILNVEGEET